MASVDGEQDVPSKLISQQWALSSNLTPLGCLGFSQWPLLHYDEAKDLCTATLA